MNSFIHSVRFLSAVVVLVSLTSIANATGSFVLFTDPHGPVPIPVGVGSYDFSSELSGDPAEDIYPCSDGTCNRWEYSVESATFDKGEIKLRAGDWTWLGYFEDEPGIVAAYQEGVDFHLVTPSGRIKETVRIQYFSEGEGEDFDDWLLVSYLNSARGTAFGMVPDDAWRFGRNYRYTSIALDRPRDGIWFGDSYVSALRVCDLCVVVYRTPEPESLALLTLGFVGLGFARRRSALLKERQ